MNFDTFPTAISIAGFRSFDANLSTLRPLRRLNFIVGQNNSGKSNILRALAVVASTFGPDPRHKLRGVDFHEDGGAIRLLLWFPLRFLAAVANARGRNPNREVQEALAKLDRDGDFPCPIRIASSGDLSLTRLSIRYS